MTRGKRLPQSRKHVPKTRRVQSSALATAMLAGPPAAGGQPLQPTLVGSAHFIDHLRVQGGYPRLRFYCF